MLTWKRQMSITLLITHEFVTVNFVILSWHSLENRSQISVRTLQCSKLTRIWQDISVRHLRADGMNFTGKLSNIQKSKLSWHIYMHANIIPNAMTLPERWAGCGPLSAVRHGEQEACTRRNWLPGRIIIIIILPTMFMVLS